MDNGKHPATDKDFLEWCERQTQVIGARVLKHGTLYAMRLYVQHLNIEGKILYERQLKEHNDQIHSTNPVDAVPILEPSETKAPDVTDGSIMNIPNLQIISPPIPRTFPLPTPRTFPIPVPRTIQLPLS
jgi:hypothetical protein